MALAGIQLSFAEQQVGVQQTYERALEQDPNDFHSFSALVRMLMRQQAFAQAETHILAGMKRFRDAWQLQMLMAQLQLSLDNYAMAASAQHKAIEIYENAMPFLLQESAEQLKPEEQIDLYSNLGIIYFLWGMRTFESYSQAVIEEQQESARQFALDSRKYFTSAQSVYQQALRLNPEDVFLQNEYARICFNIADLSPPEQQTEQWSEVIQQFSKVLNSSAIGVLGISQVREASVFLAHAHSRSKRFEEAHHLLSIMQACHPNEWLPHYARVCFYSLRAQYFAQDKPQKNWRQDMQADLEAGLAVLERVTHLVPRDEITGGLIIYDKDLAFLRKNHQQVVERLCMHRQKNDLKG